MKPVKKIDFITNWFISEYDRLAKEKRMPTNVELAKILNFKSKSTINNILNKHQNIQPEAWKLFKEHFNIQEKTGSSEFVEPTMDKEPTAKEILLVLSQALNKHEASSMRHAEVYEKFAEAIKSQADLLKSIESKMAQRESQATIEDKMRAVEERTKGMDSNLIRTLVGVETLSRDSEQSLDAIRDLSLEVKAQKKETSPDVGKRSGQTNGAGKKPRKSLG